jgi:hypothetical protein
MTVAASEEWKANGGNVGASAKAGVPEMGMDHVRDQVVNMDSIFDAGLAAEDGQAKVSTFAELKESRKVEEGSAEKRQEGKGGSAIFGRIKQSSQATAGPRGVAVGWSLVTPPPPSGVSLAGLEEAERTGDVVPVALATVLSPPAKVVKYEARKLGFKLNEKVPVSVKPKVAGKRKGPKKYFVNGAEISRSEYLSNQREAHERRAAQKAKQPGFFNEMKLGRSDKTKRDVILSAILAKDQEDYKKMTKDQLLLACVENHSKVERTTKLLAKKKKCIGLLEHALAGMAEYAIGDGADAGDRRQEIHLRMRQLVLTEDTNEFIPENVDLLVKTLSYAYGVCFWGEEGVFISRWEAEHGNNNGG